MNVLIPVLIALLIFAFSIVGFLYIKEQQRLRQKARLQKISDLNTKIDQIKTALKVIPPRLLSQEFRLFLVDYWLTIAHEQKNIESAYDNSDSINKARQFKEDIKNNVETDEQKEKISEIEVASYIRRTLRTLHQMVAELYRAKKLTPETTKKFIDEIKKAFTDALVEVYYSIATVAVRNQKYGLAAAQYEKIIQELIKGDVNKYREDIEKYKKMSAQLRSKAEEQRAQEDLKLAKKPHEPSTLEKQLDKMLEAENEWKRKSEY